MSQLLSWFKIWHFTLQRIIILNIITWLTSSRLAVMCGWSLADSVCPPNSAGFKGLIEFVVVQLELSLLIRLSIRTINISIRRGVEPISGGAITTMAFFNISHSSMTNSSSFRSRRSYASWGRNRPYPGNAFSLFSLCFLIQPCGVLWLIPKSGKTSRTSRFFFNTRRTVSILNALSCQLFICLSSISTSSFYSNILSFLCVRKSGGSSKTVFVGLHIYSNRLLPPSLFDITIFLNRKPHNYRRFSYEFLK